MIFWRFFDVDRCADSLCVKCFLDVFGEVVWDIALLLPSFWIWFGVVLYVACHDFSHAYRCLDFSFETIAFMCGDMARVSVWSVVIGLVCWPLVWPALFDLVCLVWFRMVWPICADWLVLVSSVWWFLFVFVCRCSYCAGQVVLIIYLGRHDLVCSVLLCPSLFCSLWSALVWSSLLCSRQVCCRWSQSRLVRSGVFWSGLLCFTLDWYAMVLLVSLFFYRLVWFKLVCPFCCARVGLVRQHDCDVKGSWLSQYVGRGQGSAAGTAEDHMTCLYFSQRRLGPLTWSLQSRCRVGEWVLGEQCSLLHSQAMGLFEACLGQRSNIQTRFPFPC